MTRPSAAIGAGVTAEIAISYLLRIGVVVSVALIVIGTVISFLHHPDYLHASGALHTLATPGASFPHTPRSVLDGLTTSRGQAIVMVGLGVLIATPIMRVGISIAAFVRERDWTFTAITAVVFALLVLSLLLGRAGG